MRLCDERRRLRSDRDRQAEGGLDVPKQPGLAPESVSQSSRGECHSKEGDMRRFAIAAWAVAAECIAASGFESILRYFWVHLVGEPDAA